MKRKRVPPAVRFAAQSTLVESGCIEWTGSVNNKGYATFTVTPGRTVVAHRYAYETTVGPIPLGMVLDHLCRNRACVNPDHLEPVTQSENLLRAEGVGKGNTRKTHCPQGHPYSGDNLYLAPSRPNRMCRACRRQSKMKGKAA